MIYLLLIENKGVEEQVKYIMRKQTHLDYVIYYQTNKLDSSSH